MTAKDSTFEWVASGRESEKHKRNRIYLIAAFIAFLAASIVTRGLVYIVLAMIFGVLTVRSKNSREIEYEYSYQMGEFQIFCISNASRRKKVFSCNMDQIQYARKGVDDHTSILPYYFHKDTAWTLQVNNNRGQNGVVIEQPDPRFVELLEQARKVRH